MAARRVTILSSSADIRRQIRDLFASSGWQIQEYTDWQDFSAGPGVVDAAILECSAEPGDAGLRLARHIRAGNSRTPIVIVARKGSEDLAIEALRLGVADYLKPPLDVKMLERIMEAIGKPPDRPSSSEMAIIGESAAISGIKQFIHKVAASESNVLILGETGTGKEMVAEQVHRRGARRGKPFICVNCSAIPDGLLESELFGYEKGAFTGAVSAREGKLAQAHQGTLFFDEIGDMSVVSQAKILRVIESKEVYRLGGNRPTRVDVRIIAATNRNLEQLMSEDRFRTDLYFRLNVARIELPPLRERRADIPLLLDHFLSHYNNVFNAAVERFEDRALDGLMEYQWPGNVRELRNVVEIVYLNLNSNQTVVRRLPEQVLSTWRKLSKLPQDEREKLVSVLLATHWNVSEAARQMHWSRMTMYRRLAKYNISPERGLTSREKALKARASASN